MSIWDFPESLSRAMLVGRLGVGADIGIGSCASARVAAESSARARWWRTSLPTIRRRKEFGGSGAKRPRRCVYLYKDLLGERQAQTASFCARRVSLDRRLVQARLARAKKAVATVRWWLVN